MICCSFVAAANNWLLATIPTYWLVRVLVLFTVQKLGPHIPTCRCVGVGRALTSILLPLCEYMKYVRPAFRKLNNREIVTIGYQCVNFHTIIDFKTEDFRRKTRLVVGGHLAKSPATPIDIICLEQFAFEGSGNPKWLNHSACHREDMDSPVP